MQRDSRRKRWQSSRIGGIRDASRRSLDATVRILALAGLLATFTGCTDTPAARIAQIYAWAKVGEPADVERIAPRVNDPDRDVRIAAIQALASIGAADAESTATAALADKDPDVRSAAVGCLVRLGARTQLYEISELFASDPDAGVRRACVAFARKAGGDAADELMATAVRDPDRAVRIFAVLAMADVDPLFALDPLAGAVLGDSDWEVRAEAARVLGAAGRPEAAPALEAARSDPNEFVRAAASAARKQLTPE